MYDRLEHISYDQSSGTDYGLLIDDVDVWQVQLGP